MSVNVFFSYVHLIEISLIYAYKICSVAHEYAINQTEFAFNINISINKSVFKYFEIKAQK